VMTPLGLMAVALVSWGLTALLRRYALARRLVDVPNARSSHAVATPRGGGAAIVLATTTALAWWWSGGADALPLGILAGGLIVAGVGFVDDHGHLPPLSRLVGHTAAAILAVASLGGTASGIAAAAVAVFLVTWLINLTNFMDGIDGIAGVQTVTVCAVGGVLSVVVAPGGTYWFAPAVLAAASLGFLVWNWPPARIFMGDVGSGFVGFMVAVLTLRAFGVAPELGWSWVILSGVFVTDATVTLLRRLWQRERVLEAHRSHAYQHLAHAWGAHRRVTLLVAGINLFWLAPIAALVTTHHLSGPIGLVLAYGPLAAGAGWLGAGRPGRTGEPC
jgi:Fuc2NAc and GlcNAc transferase